MRATSLQVSPWPTPWSRQHVLLEGLGVLEPSLGIDPASEDWTLSSLTPLMAFERH
jgi:hypothetical protein